MPWIVMRDGWVMDGVFDTGKGAADYCEYMNGAGYIGNWNSIYCEDDEEVSGLLHGYDDALFGGGAMASAKD